MKKVIGFSVLTAMALSAQILPTNVLNKSSLSIENGGTKSAIDAYSDGGGDLIIGDSSSANKPVDNSPMNELVFKYGQEAKSNNVNLVDEVKTLSTTSTAYDKTLADKIDISALTPKDGTSCDDKNVQTINDVFVSGVCKGNNVEGQACDDKNQYTTNDIYHNGVCSGTLPTASNTCATGFNGVIPYSKDCSQSMNGLAGGWLNTTGVNGSLLLWGNNITNIDALSNLTSVVGGSGALDLHSNSFSNVNGLKNLKTVGYINMINNTSLQDLSGLNNVTSINNLYLDVRSYSVKMEANSYICQHFNSVVNANGSGGFLQSYVCK